MEILIQIVFLILPLIIAIYNLDVFYGNEDTKTKVKKLSIRVLMILLLIGLNFQFGELIGRKDMALIGAVSGTVFLVFLLLICEFTKIGMKLYDNYTLTKILNDKNQIEEVKDVNNLGFTINYKEDLIFYNWQNVTSIKLKSHFAEKRTIKTIGLSFRFSDSKKKLNINNHFTNFYYLLRNIPNGYDLMDYNFVESLFKNLKTCSFCGLVSYYNGRCLNCICSLDFWTEEQKEDYPTIEDYIKEEQLELFATYSRSEIFNEFKMISLSFEQDKNWKPLVSKQQVLQYSKENCW